MRVEGGGGQVKSFIYHGEEINEMKPTRNAPSRPLNSKPPCLWLEGVKTNCNFNVFFRRIKTL